MKRNVVILCVALWSLLLMAETAMAQTQTITVGRGETFALIAKRYGMTVDELKQMNPSAIDGVVGMKLQVKLKKVEKQAAVSTPTSISSSSKFANKKDNKKKNANEEDNLDEIWKIVLLSEEAAAYIQKEEIGKAIKTYDKLIKLNPNGRWYMEKGTCYSIEEKYKTAIKQYEIALARNDMDNEQIDICKEYLANAKRLQNEKSARRKAAWANVGAALAVGVAVAGTAYAASQQSSSQSYANTYTSPVYTSSNATSQFGARSDQILANANRTAQQIGQNAIAQSQQMSQRANQANREQMNWAINFKNKNGREPTEYEMDNWLRTNYPDLWQMKIQAASNTTSSSTHSSSVSTETEAKKSTKSTFTCAYCNGSGRILYDDDGGVPHFGLEMKYRGTCSECGAKLYEGYPHKHMQCNHCKGTGKQSY